MAAEGEATNPAGGGGGGDSYPHEVVAAADEAAQAAVAQGAGQEPVGEMANREGADGGGAEEKDDGAYGDLVLVEGPEALAVEGPDEVIAAAALQEEMKALVASIPDGAGAAFTAMKLQELEQQSRVYQYMAARVPVPTHLIFPIWKSVSGASCFHHFDGLSYALFGLGERPITRTREVPMN